MEKYLNLILEKIKEKVIEDELIINEDGKYDLIKNSYYKKDEDEIKEYIIDLLKNNLDARKALASDSYRLITNEKMRKKVADNFIFTYWPKVLDY